MVTTIFFFALFLSFLMVALPTVILGAGVFVAVGFFVGTGVTAGFFVGAGVAVGFAVLSLAL